MTTTSDTILNVKPGDTVTLFCNGAASRHTVTEVRFAGLHDVQHSRTYGHAYAKVVLDGLTSKFGGDATISYFLDCDAYYLSIGFLTHDANGNRIRGCEIEPA